LKATRMKPPAATSWLRIMAATATITLCKACSSRASCVSVPHFAHVAGCLLMPSPFSLSHRKLTTHMHMGLHCVMTPKESHAAVPCQSGIGTTAQYCSATTSSVQGLLRSLEVSARLPVAACTKPHFPVAWASRSLPPSPVPMLRDASSPRGQYSPGSELSWHAPQPSQPPTSAQKMQSRVSGHQVEIKETHLSGLLPALGVKSSWELLA
jgi:hypothetical protein